MALINFLVDLFKYRFYIMWAYIFIVIVLLVAPLPFDEGYQTEKTAGYSHFLLFFLFGVIVEFAYLFSFNKETIIKTFAFAVIMEFIQLLLPYRVFDFADMGMNVGGLLVSYTSLFIWKTHT